MAEIGIAYALADGQAVNDLAGIFSRAGHNVVCKGYGPDELHVEDSDTTAIDGADIVVVAWSAESRKSIWVRSTAERASARGRLMPVKLCHDLTVARPDATLSSAPCVDQPDRICAAIEQRLRGTTDSAMQRWSRSLAALVPSTDFDRRIAAMGLLACLISFTAVYLGLDVTR